MANIINIGLDSVSTIKIGSDNVAAVYVGDVKVYPQTVVQPKMTAYYSDGTTYEIMCDSSSTLSKTEVRGHSTSYTAMTDVVIGDCVDTIGDEAFRIGNYSAAGSLSSITLSDSVTTIGNGAFRYNGALRSFVMPNSVTSIGQLVFSDCTNLTSVTISSGLTSLPRGTFYGTSIPSITIPSNITNIGYTAFYNCKNTSSIEIPNSVTTIGNRAFVNVGNNISSGASITIGSGCTSIGYNAFSNFGTSNSASTNVVTIYAANPPSMETTTASQGNIWGFKSNTVIYVPCDSVDAYKADEYWGVYSDKIQAIPNSCPQTPQWVTFNSGDVIPTTLDIYGIKGNANDLSYTFVGSPISCTPSRRNVDIMIWNRANTYVCYSNTVTMDDDVEYIFSDISCDDYVNLSEQTNVYGTIQLYIYQ